jgi:hypothetical protein
MRRYAHLFSMISIMLAIGVPLASCHDAITRQDAETILFDNFKTVVPTAPGDGYTPYWLGREFEAGGQQFRGPYTSAIELKVPGGGVSTDYDAEKGTLTITSYSQAAWAQSPLNKSPLPQAAITAPVTAGAHAGKLIRVPLRGRPNLLEVVFDLGETVVVATTFVDASHPNATPNPNPLVDEATLLAVLAQMPPYPQ